MTYYHQWVEDRGGTADYLLTPRLTYLHILYSYHYGGIHIRERLTTAFPELFADEFTITEKNKFEK